MVDSLIDQLKARGEAFLTEVSNNLMANPTFIEMLKKGLAAKEAVDKQVADAMKSMNVATRKEVRGLENRLASLEAELAELRARAVAAARKPRPRPRPRKPAASKK